MVSPRRCSNWPKAGEIIRANRSGGPPGGKAITPKIVVERIWADRGRDYVRLATTLHNQNDEQVLQGFHVYLVRRPGSRDAKDVSMKGYFEDFAVGSCHQTYGRTITESDIVTLRCFAGYHTPLFIDEEYAKTTAFGGRIAPCSLTMAISTAMTEGLFRDTIIALKAVTDGQVLLPVRPGDTIRTMVEIVSKRETSKPDRGLVVFRDHALQKSRLVRQVAAARRRAPRLMSAYDPQTPFPDRSGALVVLSHQDRSDARAIPGAITVNITRNIIIELASTG